jgi:ketosteroid isomerase-like protein
VIKAYVISLAVLPILAAWPCNQLRALQTDASTAASTSDEDQIRAFDQRWCDAEFAHNRKALEQILADGFVATFEDGETFEKAAFIDLIMKYNFRSSFNTVHDIIRVHGDTAIVVARFGFGDTLRTKVTAVVMKQNGQWRAVAEQMTGLSAPPPAAAPTPTAK